MAASNSDWDKWRSNFLKAHNIMITSDVRNLKNMDTLANLNLKMGTLNDETTCEFGNDREEFKQDVSDSIFDELLAFFAFMK